MKIEIKGIDNFNRSLSKLSGQLDYALSRTINDLAFDSKGSLEKEVQHGMNVRANTSKAFAVDKSSKTDLTATVRLKDDWHKDVVPQHYRGGEGAIITFEKAMIGGRFMNSNQSAIPIKKMGKTTYGNILTELRHGIGNHFIVGSNNRDKRTSHLHPGVYKRLKRKVKPVILFTPEAIYKKRFDMKRTVEKVVSRRANKIFYKHLTEAMRTSR